MLRCEKSTCNQGGLPSDAEPFHSGFGRPYKGLRARRLTRHRWLAIPAKGLWNRSAFRRIVEHRRARTLHEMQSVASSGRLDPQPGSIARDRRHFWRDAFLGVRAETER